MTKEKPIIFSAPMVRAILDGRKTQTRRLMPALGPQAFWQEWEGRGAYRAQGLIGDIPAEWRSKILYAKVEVGDVLYVRERARTWDGVEFQYFADASPDEQNDLKFWPSIHMPRKAARLFLEVTTVQVQRLNEISDDDVRAEGLDTLDNFDWVKKEKRPGFVAVPPGGEDWMRPRDAFAVLWDSLHGPGAWALNPWVWAYTFKRASA